MQSFVNILTGKTITHVAGASEASDALDNARAKIWDTEGMPAVQRLSIWRVKQLENGMPHADSRLYRDSVLQRVL